MKKFQKNNLNKKDHEKVDKGAKVVTGAVGTVGMCVLAVVKFAPKIIKKVTKL